MSIVIIGNSAAGIGCIEAIRAEDKDVHIILISDEKYHTYSRPGITYLLGGKIDEKKMLYRPLDFYEKHKIETRFSTKIVKVDPKKKVCVTEGGEEIAYRKLLIATGGTPFVPPIKGKDKKNVFSFTKWSDAEEVMELVKSKKRAVVVGAGMIGTKTVEGLSFVGCDVTVVELGKNVLGLALDDTASSMVAERMKEKNIKVRTGNEVTEIYGDDAVEGVILRDGEKIACDFVVIAVGVFPNTTLVKESGIEINRGIVVDAKQQSSIEDIYAAGDCAEGDDILAGLKRPIPIWPVAYSQGQVAGRNMIGLESVHPGSFPLNAIEFDGVPTISVGIANPPEDEEYEVVTFKDKNVYKKVVLKDNIIKGALFVGDITRAGLLTGLIERGEDVSGYKEQLLKEDLGFVYYRPDLRVGKTTTNSGWKE